MAHSDATDYITPASFKADNEHRTRAKSLEDSHAAATPYPHLELVTGIEPATY
jgi:hypothetical protein